MPALVREAYPPHLLAQKLNNRGALCIETKLVDRNAPLLQYLGQGTLTWQACRWWRNLPLQILRFGWVHACQWMNPSVPPRRSWTRQDMTPALLSMSTVTAPEGCMPRRSQEETSSSEDFECGGYIHLPACVKDAYKKRFSSTKSPTNCTNNWRNNLCNRWMNWLHFTIIFANNTSRRGS
jgi:hypothetical protein